MCARIWLEVGAFDVGEIRAHFYVSDVDELEGESDGPGAALRVSEVVSAHQVDVRGQNFDVLQAVDHRADRVVVAEVEVRRDADVGDHIFGSETLNLGKPGDVKATLEVTELFHKVCLLVELQRVLR